LNAAEDMLETKATVDVLPQSLWVNHDNHANYFTSYV